MGITQRNCSLTAGKTANPWHGALCGWRFERALEQQGAVFTRPKELADVRGVSYTFSLLWRFGMISAPADVERKLKGNRK